METQHQVITEVGRRGVRGDLFDVFDAAQQNKDSS
jgi:hypothetical protein